MKSATNVQPSAGHGNGSVLTQNQPLWSPSSSPSHSSSSDLELEVGEHCRVPGGAPVPRGHNSHVPDPERRDVAARPLGRRDQRRPARARLPAAAVARRALWARVGWIYGTSAGALSGTMAALDRLDDLEEFLLGLQPADAFRPRPVWQFPGGLARLHAPRDDRRPHRLARPSSAPRCATARHRARRLRDRRRRLPGRRRRPRLRARVLLAVDRAGGDGSRDPRVGRDQRPRAPGRARRRASRPTAAGCGTSRSSTRTATPRSPRSPRSATSRATRRPTPHSSNGRASGSSASAPFLPCARCWRRSGSRRSASARGEPAHYGELIVRLMRVAFARNAVVEERLAAERETSVAELRRLREDVTRAALAAAAPWRRKRLARRARRALRRRALPLPARPPCCRPSSSARQPASTASTRRSAATRRGRTSRSAPWSSAATRLTDASHRARER